MATKQAHQAQVYEQISPKAYEHPADRAATSALHSVPLLDRVIKKLADLGYERQLRQTLMGNSVRLGPDQVPATYALYLDCVASLDLERTPDLYISNNPFANAMAVGAESPLIVVRSSLVSGYTEPEIKSVLAHETAHVLSEHAYYTTALVLISQIMLGALPRSLVLGLPIRALYAALLEWSRAAELSSDRAAALVMGDPLDPCRMLMRMAGGSVAGMNFDAFVTQATDYLGEEDIFSRQSRFWVEIGQTHPFAVRRVKELVGWIHAGNYDRIRDGDYPRRGEEPPPSAEFNAAVAHYKERFAIFLDRLTNDVQRVTTQFGDWLSRWSSPGTAADRDDEGTEAAYDVGYEEPTPGTD